MPDIRLISERSDADIKRDRAAHEIEFSLRELAANLLRISRGAGRPAVVLDQMNTVEEAFSKYRDACGQHPSPQIIEQALRLDSGEWELRDRMEKESNEAAIERWDKDGTFDRIEAEHTILRGSLQIAASRLLGQKTQESAGDGELRDGMRLLEEARKTYKKAHRI